MGSAQRREREVAATASHSERARNVFPGLHIRARDSTRIGTDKAVCVPGRHLHVRKIERGAAVDSIFRFPPAAAAAALPN